MFRTLIAILLILVGVVGIAGGIWGLSMRTDVNMDPTVLNTALTVIDYADNALSAVDGKIAEATDSDFSLRSFFAEQLGIKEINFFVFVHAMELLLGGIIGVETGLLLFKFGRR